MIKAEFKGVVLADSPTPINLFELVPKSPSDCGNCPKKKVYCSGALESEAEANFLLLVTCSPSNLRVAVEGSNCGLTVGAITSLLQ